MSGDVAELVEDSEIITHDLDFEEIEALISTLPKAQQRQFHDMLAKAEIAQNKRLGRTSFLGFVKYVWPGFIEGNHHKIMANAFDRIASGELKRLIVCMPPRMSKSEFASIHFPSYFLGRFPKKKVMICSHTSELAVGFGRKVRNLITGTEFQELFPTKVAGDNKAAGRWGTDEGGELFALGVGGMLSGRGADCLHSSTRLVVPGGEMTISAIASSPDPVYVLGYEKHSKTVSFRRVEALASREVFGIRRITTTSGRVVEATGNHPFWAADGEKITAGRLAPGDVLLCAVRAGSDARSLRGEQEHNERKCKPILLADVLGSTGEREPLRQTDLLCVRRTGAQGHRTGDNETALLLGSLQVDPAGTLQSRDGSSHADILLPGMPEDIYGESLSGEGGAGRGIPAALLDAVQKPGGSPQSYWRFHEYRPGSQGGVEGGRNEGPSPWNNPISVFVPAPAGVRQGQEPLRSVSRQVQVGNPPCGQQSDEQRYGEHGDALPPLPQPGNVSPGWAVETDTVSMVEDLCGNYTVWDIQVEGTHNFFANGILVFNCLIIDDPHSEGQGAMAMTNPEVMEPTFDWFTSGPRQRLQPGGAMIIVATRWHASDLIGRVLEQAAKNSNGQQWEVIEFPAILPSGRSLWPQYWPLAELEAIKAEIPAYKWNAQYLQRPGGAEVSIIKRDYWKKWTKADPPEIEVVMSAFDTAFTKEKRSNYSACVVLGIFYRTVVKSNGDEEQIPNIILLDAWKERLDFPDLKRKMLEHYEERRPDIFMIENRATGSPLIQEFRAMGLVVSEFTPARGMGKTMRVNAVVDIFASGRVWAPDTSWAEDVINQCEVFPFGAEDDYVDCISMALMRFREGGMITTNKDDLALSDEDKTFKAVRRQYY